MRYRSIGAFLLILIPLAPCTGQIVDADGRVIEFGIQDGEAAPQQSREAWLRAAIEGVNRHEAADVASLELAAQGRSAAASDLASGRMILRTTGFRRNDIVWGRYSLLLHERRVRFEVTDRIGPEDSGYNAVMLAEIELRYGGGSLFNLLRTAEQLRSPLDRFPGNKVMRPLYDQSGNFLGFNEVISNGAQPADISNAGLNRNGEGNLRPNPGNIRGAGDQISPAGSSALSNTAGNPTVPTFEQLVATGMSPEAAEGRVAAAQDIASGRLVQRTQPTPGAPWSSGYASLLRARGIELESSMGSGFPGSYTGPEFDRYQRESNRRQMVDANYNLAMKEEIERRFGTGILEQLLQQARNGGGSRNGFDGIRIQSNGYGGPQSFGPSGPGAPSGLPAPNSPRGPMTPEGSPLPDPPDGSGAAIPSGSQGTKPRQVASFFATSQQRCRIS